MWWRKKPLVLNLYTDNAQAFEMAQWQRSATVKPEWWKKLPNPNEIPVDELNLLSTSMKGCAGFNRLYSNSFLVPMWSDVLLEFDGTEGNADNWKYQFADMRSSADVHTPDMRGDYLPHDQWQHFKLKSPWIAHCDQDLEFLFTNAGYSQNDPSKFFVPNGVVNYRDQVGTDVNIMLKRDTGSKKVLIETSEIMAMLVPLTDRKVTLKHHLVTSEEVKRIGDMANPKTSFVMSYYKAKKCPFRQSK
jgi:hypothetical protein